MQEFWTEEAKDAFLKSWRIFLVDAPVCNVTYKGRLFKTMESMKKGIETWESVSAAMLSTYSNVSKERKVPSWNEIRAMGNTLRTDIDEMVSINPLLKQGITLDKGENVFFMDSFKTASATAKNCEVKDYLFMHDAFNALIDNVVKQVEQDFEKFIAMER